ncbi:hypothetical protein EV356DRAFT_519625 [Viridothelium virens]|uniref:Cytochrome P450 n=1 Tax=Viridothelium virens TaxID=1048519 RepID=A0A6A6HKJ2_VIRVR|nr:hypothetical protein EV356DRAFT_519625 [Viridothelium virens]
MKRSQSSSSGGPVSLLLGGSSVCFITLAKDAHSIHKNSTAFDHDKFLQLTARQFGVSRQGVQKLWTRNGSGSSNSRPIADIMVIVRRELSALRRPNGLPNSVLEQIQHLSSRDNWSPRSWMVLFGIPMPWSLKMRWALNRTQHAIKIYLNLSPERKADASLVMKHLEEAMNGKGFLQTDVPAVLSLIYWGVYQETLRFTASTGSARKAQTEQLLGGKKIRSHTDLIIIYREMLIDSDIFGRDSDKFAWHRFLNNNELSKGPGFEPFGGGVGQCPDRFLAQSEILSLIALAVTRFNLEVDIGSSVPNPDTKTPSLGMMGPVSGQDMLSILVGIFAEARQASQCPPLPIVHQNLYSRGALTPHHLNHSLPHQYPRRLVRHVKRFPKPLVRLRCSFHIKVVVLDKMNNGQFHDESRMPTPRTKMDVLTMLWTHDPRSENLWKRLSITSRAYMSSD